MNAPPHLPGRSMIRIAHREIGKLYQREGLLDRDLLLEIDEGVIGTACCSVLRTRPTVS